MDSGRAKTEFFLKFFITKPAHSKQAYGAGPLTQYPGLITIFDLPLFLLVRLSLLPLLTLCVEYIT